MQFFAKLLFRTLLPKTTQWIYSGTWGDKGEMSHAKHWLSFNKVAAKSISKGSLGLVKDGRGV